jgi:hypothetical protein
LYIELLRNILWKMERGVMRGKTGGVGAEMSVGEGRKG